MALGKDNFQKKRWAVRVFNLLPITAFVLVIVFNAKQMPAWLIVLICAASVLLLTGGRIFCGYFCPVVQCSANSTGSAP